MFYMWAEISKNVPRRHIYNTGKTTRVSVLKTKEYV